MKNENDENAKRVEIVWVPADYRKDLKFPKKVLKRAVDDLNLCGNRNVPVYLGQERIGVVVGAKYYHPDGVMMSVELSESGRNKMPDGKYGFRGYGTPYPPNWVLRLMEKIGLIKKENLKNVVTDFHIDALAVLPKEQEGENGSGRPISI